MICAPPLKITICPNVTASGALISLLNLPQTTISVYDCLTSQFMPEQVCPAAAAERKQKWPHVCPDRMANDMIFQYAEVQATYFCLKVDFPSYSNIMHQYFFSLKKPTVTTTSISAYKDNLEQHKWVSSARSNRFLQ